MALAANRLSLVKIEPSVQSFALSFSSSSSSLLSWSPYLTLSSVSPLAHPNQATFRLHVSFFLATHSSLSLSTSYFSPHVGWEAMRKPQEAEAIGCEEAGGRWTRRWRPSWTLQTSRPMGSNLVGLRPMTRSGLSSSRATSTWRQDGLFFLLISSRHLSCSIPLTTSLLTLSMASSSSSPSPHLQIKIVP